MSFNLKSKVSNVSALKVTEKSISYVKNGKLKFNDYEFDINALFYQIDYRYNKIWVKDHNWNNFVINFIKKEITIFPFNLMINGYFKDNLLINRNNCIFIYSTRTSETILKLKNENIKYYYFNKHFVYLQVDLKIKSLSLTTGNYDWEINLGEYGYYDTHLGNVEANIRQIIGLSENILVVFMGNGSLVGIDVNKGIIQWDIPFNHQYYPPDYQGDKWCWHLEDGYLYLLQHRYYLRIDLATQKLDVLWSSSDKHIDIEHCSYSEQNGYFMAINTEISMIQPCVLGVFDRKALKIVWQHDQPIYSSQPPQSDGDKLYCLDNEGTLHIFERDK